MASSPKAPDPYKTASAQEKAEMAASQSSAIINNPNEYNTYGQVNYDIAGWEQVQGTDGKMRLVPRYNRKVTLTPAEQKIADLDQATRTNMGTTASQVSATLPAYFAKSVDKTGWNPWQAGHQFNEATDRPAIEAALMARQNEAMTKRSAQEDAALAARGLNTGSEQYGSVADARARAMTDAQQQAYLASGQEARQNYGTAQSHWEFENLLRQAQEQSSYAERNQKLNEINALMSGSQVNLPQFAAFSRQGVNAAPIGQYIQDNYAQKSANANAFNQGLFGVIGAGLGAGGYAYGKSDRRLKEDIVPLGPSLAGAPLYMFRYKGRPELQIGVMSDEVRALHPDAVHVDADGFDLVNYGLLAERAA